MTAIITREISFEAAHRLPNVAKDHKCSRMHGHSYRCEIQVAGAIGDKSGWVIDYADIDVAFAPLFAQLDHHTLNDIPGLENPTSECLAKWVWQRLDKTLAGLFAIVIHETCSARSWYSERDMAALSLLG
ncbi:MAG TPA: 6-carboxytetrahydropterin synthase QueD [Flavobacteriales bacterium]|nr:6-carboxytetrahydropterin synthase QueD [Flavobacteriales bacterium]HIB76598.1 6-carboxytetrahydropterin synthase QueD [Flavobacteriales bacterium]